MEHRYSHILQPVRIRNKVLKNHLIASKCLSKEILDPVDFYNEPAKEYLAGLAKNGASAVTVEPGTFGLFADSSFFSSDIDLEKYTSRHSVWDVIQRIHAYGGLVCAATASMVPNNVSISSMPDRSIVPSEYRPGPESPFDEAGNVYPEMSVQYIKQFIEDYSDSCLRLRRMGFDMINVYASYCASILAKSLSPVFNQRTDEYGGSKENRARLLVELMTAVKKKCGDDFIIELQLSGREWAPGGYGVEDFLDYCEMFQGLADIYQIRAWDGDASHTSSYSSTKECPTTIQFTEAFKKRGIKGLVCAVGGFQDLDVIDGLIAQGKTDLVGMARAFICDPEYGVKLLEGRGEDVAPCIRCDKCHDGMCSVNPKVGNEGAVSLVSPPRGVKKVAVIGGGPSGMEAALTAAARGHKVTLFEKNGFLGGQLIHTDYMPDKWSLRDFKDYLARQVYSAGVEVRLNTQATPELIESGHFDAVIAGCGSVPKTGPVPGGDKDFVWAPIDVFGHEGQLGRQVVVIGGTMTAVDTALYLAHSGHMVTIVTRGEEAAYDNTTHSHFGFADALAAEPNISVIAKAQTTAVFEDRVEYKTAGGNVETLMCDSVVFSAGRRPLVDECCKFMGLAPQFFIVGDANMLSGAEASPKNHLDSLPGRDSTTHDVRHSVATGFFCASMI